jgi:hypothetical protein
LIWPPAEVFAKAQAKVLQGAVRLQGFWSLPTPDTQVRVAPPACAMVQPKKNMPNAIIVFIMNVILLIFLSSPLFRL